MAMSGSDDPGAERSAKMLKSAVELFARHGFAATDVQQIADAAGVGKGTVYRHFGNKEGLFLAAARFVRDEVHQIASAEAARAATPLERLSRGVKAFSNYFRNHPEAVELFIQERATFRDKTTTFFDDSDRRSREWVELFQQLIDEGMLRRVPVIQLRTILARFVFGSLFVRYLGGSALYDENEDALFELLLTGLLAPGDVKPPAGDAPHG
jgi:AcrR family transcriptional regulator